MTHLLQLLCKPNGHCIAAIVYDDTHGTVDDAGKELAEFLEAAKIEKRCALCGTSRFAAENKPTGFMDPRQAFLPCLMEGAKKMVVDIMDHRRRVATN